MITTKSEVKAITKAVTGLMNDLHNSGDITLAGYFCDKMIGDKPVKMFGHEVACMGMTDDHSSTFSRVDQSPPRRYD